MAVLLVLADGLILWDTLTGFVDGLQAHKTRSELGLRALHRVLLLLIVAELLFTLRLVIARGEIATEPFWFIGIIAVVRRVVVITAQVENLPQLGAPLDVLVVRRIGAPVNPEYGIGAFAEGDVGVLDESAVRQLYVSHEELESAIAGARAEVDAGVERYRGERLLLDLEGRTVPVIPLTEWVLPDRAPYVVLRAAGGLIPDARLRPVS